MPKGKPLGDISGGKVCPGCQEHKELTQFYKSKSFANGYESYCKKCRNAKYEKYRVRSKEEMARRSREWRAKNPERTRDYFLKMNYGAEPGTYDSLLAAQNGGCAICKKGETGGRGKHFRLDHCHTTGIIRGLLCNNCNFGLGHFFDSPELLSAAISYLAERRAKGGG